MTTAGRIITAGWVLLLLCVLGAALGFLLYTKLVIGVTIERQLSFIKFDQAFEIETEATNIADFRILGSVPIKLPLHSVALPLELKGTYTANVGIDTQIPIDITARFSESILIDTNLEVVSDIKMVSRWLPRLPVKGVIPIRFELPVAFDVPIDTQMPFKYHGPITFSLDQTIRTTTNQFISTTLELDHQTTAAINNRFKVSVDGEKALIPISFDNVTVQIPLSTIKYSPTKLHSKKH